MNELKDMTCKDCKKRNWCMEWSRLYPCTSFEKKEEIDYMTSKHRRLEEGET